MSNLSVLVHPQAMLGMSYHFTRMKYDEKNADLPIQIGIFVGQSTGSKIEISATLELLVTGEKGDLVVDRPFINSSYKDIHLFSFPKDLALGWYTCKKLDDDLFKELAPKVEQLINEFDSQSRLFGEFFYDPKENKGEEIKSPLSLYLLHNTQLTPVHFTYEAEQAELIAMLTLQSEGSADDQTQFTAKAFQSLDLDLEKVQKYLERVLKKEVPFNPEFVRRAATLAQWWDHNNLEEKGFDKVEEQADLALLCGMLLETLTLYEKQSC